MLWSRLFKLFFVVRNENIILPPLVEACWIIHHRCPGSRKINLLRRRMRIFNKVTQNIWKKDIGIGILKSIKNKIIIFKLFQERPPLKINQRRESSAIQDLWKFCSFYNNLCTWQKVPKTFNNTDEKFLKSSKHWWSIQQERRRHENNIRCKHDRSPSHQAHSNVSIAYRLQHNPIQVSVHGYFALKRRRLSVACAKVQVLAIDSHHPS